MAAQGLFDLIGGMDNGIVKRFLTGSDDTGRFIVKSVVTGKTYFVEPIDDGQRTEWGDLNPATKKLEGDYGTKHRGAVNEKDSMITRENGFENIVTLEPGVSPLDYINRIDKEYEMRMTGKSQV
jgi:hypothetical protein